MLSAVDRYHSPMPPDLNNTSIDRYKIQEIYPGFTLFLLLSYCVFKCP